MCDWQIDMREDRLNSCYGLHSIAVLALVGLACCVLAKLVEWWAFRALSFSFDPWCLCAFPAGQFLLSWNCRQTVRTVGAGVCLGVFVAYVCPELQRAALPLCLGLVSIAGLGSAALVSPVLRKQALYILGAGSLVFIGHQLAQTCQYLSTAEPLSFDSRAYLIDRSMGFDTVSLVLGALYGLPTTATILVVLVLSLTYANILLVMACVVLVHLRRKSPDWAVTLTAFLLAGGIGGALYHLFPAAGPRYAFATYPVLPDIAALSANASPLAPEFIRNCMPSLHATWALLIVMNTRSLSLWPRRSALVFAGLTLIATLGMGQHYLIDLVVAVPFAVAVQTLARSIMAGTWPGLAMWFGGGCVAAWFFVLLERVYWLLTIHGLTLAASILTVVFSAAAASQRLAFSNSPRLLEPIQQR